MKMKMGRYDDNDWVDGFGFSVGVWIGLDWMGGAKQTLSSYIWKLIRPFLDLKCIVINSTKIKHRSKILQRVGLPPKSTSSPSLILTNLVSMLTSNRHRAGSVCALR
jgi:hypothetical protein